ncbi:MAG: hypothetical protein K2Y39_23670, partial [Candidatus Obscuribacterales bacterium]|nr:hypothetical protein [Candidatus Obscuribacterales bacterium]
IVPRSIPPREILYVYSADGTRQALAENSPSMSVRDLLVLNRMITGSEDLFVLFGPKRPRPSAQENTQTTTTTVLDYTQNSRTTWARANSIDKLPSIFATVERNNGFPMIVSIKVENMNWGSYPRSQGTGGHAMLLTGYNLVYDGSGAIDYAASTVTMSNSWGAASHEMTVSFEDLFRALS